MALCGVLSALSVLILCLGGLVPLATFICPMLAMGCLMPVVCDYGKGVASTMYGAVSVLALLLCTDKEISFLYLFLGWYPGFRSDMNKLPKVARCMVKCALFSLSMAAMYAMLLYLFQLDAIVEEFTQYTAAMEAGLLVLGNVVFLMFDRVLANVTVLYEKKCKN